MKVEKWVCDRCKKEFEEKKDVLECRVQLANVYPAVIKTTHVCIECGKKIGLERPGGEVKAKDMADKLLNIVYEIVEDAVSNR